MFFSLARERVFSPRRAHSHGWLRGLTSARPSWRLNSSWGRTAFWLLEMMGVAVRQGGGLRRDSRLPPGNDETRGFWGWVQSGIGRNPGSAGVRGFWGGIQSGICGGRDLRESVDSGVDSSPGSAGIRGFPAIRSLESSLGKPARNFPWK